VDNLTFKICHNVPMSIVTLIKMIRDSIKLDPAEVLKDKNLIDNSDTSRYFELKCSLGGVAHGNNHS
jgi:hypothetical protein